MITFRDPTEKDIDCRVQSVKDGKGLVLLLYKDARADMQVLDETVGPENWQTEYYEVNGIMFCRVGININYAEPEKPPVWIWKSNAGSESNTEKEKGCASDSFKRACFCWNIFRSLYSAPFIWVSAQKAKIVDGKCYDKFSVSKIRIENGEITGLRINNDSMGVVAFSWAKDKKDE